MLVTLSTWAVGESTTTLTLIPDDTKVIVNDGTDGYFDNIDKKYDGVYNISDINGKQISSIDLLIDRKKHGMIVKQRPKRSQALVKYMVLDYTKFNYSIFFVFDNIH